MKETMQEKSASGLSRRRLLTYVGTLTGVALLTDACKKDENGNNAQPKDGIIDLGSGDNGLLNYFYLLEQLQADFYIKVITNPYQAIVKEELTMLGEMRDHEIAHREFLKNLLGAGAIGSQEFDFSSVDFTSKSSVWATARTLEEATVRAYTGASPLIITTDNFMYFGKILAVEARHAAMVRNMIIPGSFADTTNSSGADTGLTPGEALEILKPHLKSEFSIKNLPQN